MTVHARNKWRLINFGDRSIAEYVATNRALLEAREEGISPNTLTFLRFKEPGVLLGYHQSADQEIRRDYCNSHGIKIQRRVSGGGALYVDKSVIGWELYLDRRVLGTANMMEVARRICETAAAAFSKLGVDAKYRPRNDIEVNGKKISGTGGIYDGDVLLYHGSLLVDHFDVETMLQALKIPAEKLSGKAISSARERVGNIKELLGYVPPLSQIVDVMTEAFSREFGIGFDDPSGLTPTEQGKFEHFLEEVQTAEWIHEMDRPSTEAKIVEAIFKGDGGLLHATVATDTFKRRIKQAWFTGDFFINPRRTIVDLEASLKDIHMDAYPDIIDNFFRDRNVEMLLLKPEDFAKVIKLALQNLCAETGTEKIERQ